jgi:prepilin peptidase CpaA
MAVVSDFREMRISNRLIASGLIWGLVLRIMGDGSAGIIFFLFNVSIPVILLFLFFQLRAVGAGDIKLFSVVGAFLTTRQLMYIIAVSFLCASVLGSGKLLYNRVLCGRDGKQRTLIHFSCSVLIGYFIVVWGCGIE